MVIKEKVRLILIFVLSVFLFSCSHSNTKNQINVSQNESIEENGDLSQFRISEAQSSTPEQKVEELENIPVEINESVNKWIYYFQNRGRVHMERYLLRSTRYEALMKKVLRDNQVPEDLFYIALIESGFSSQAFSKAAAVGYWQFIRGTGKQYKLTINKLIDERRDPVLSTQAAADYFKDLYSRFNSWYLAMAAYNVGEGRVERAIRKYKTRDFWTLAKIKRALPAETDNYVPKFIAAKLIAKNPDKYGFEGIDYMPPIEFDHIDLDKPVNLRLMAEKMNLNYEDFKALNPKYKGEIAPLASNQKLGLRIPPGSYDIALLAFNESFVDHVEYVADQNEVRQYKVARGDSFSTIARKYRTTVAYLRDINDFTRKKKLKVGQRIFVPDRTPLLEKRPQLAKNRSKNKKVHVVKRGESLSSIARRYSMSVAEIKKLNNFEPKSKLRVGARVVLSEK